MTLQITHTSIRAYRRTSAWKMLTVSTAVSLATAGCLAPAPGSQQTNGAPYEDEIGEVSQAATQDCSAILMDGVYDKYQASSSSANAYALSKGFCKVLYDHLEAGGDTEFNWGFIGGDLSGSYSTTSWSNYCEHFDSAQSAAESTNLMTSRANKDIVAAWAACVTQTGGLTCYKKPGENTIGITFEELANSGNLKQVSLTPTNLKVSNPGDVTPTLYVGDTGLAYTITNTTKDATLLINGRTELTNFGQSCSVLVKSNTSVNAEVARVWNKLASSYLAIASPLASMSVPGWHKEMRDRIIASVIAKHGNAVTQAKNCTSGASCTLPKAADYKYTYSLRGATCSSFGIPGKKVTRNVLSTTGAMEVQQVKVQAGNVTSVFSICSGTYHQGVTMFEP